MLLADSDDAVAPLICMVIFGIPALLWFGIRYMKHKERMAMIQRGLAPDVRFPGAPPPFTPPPFTPPPFGAPPPNYGMQAPRGRNRKAGNLTADEALRAGIKTAFIGLALTIGLSFIGDGPWLLGGLIPMFVGLAQVVNAILSGADISAIRNAGFMPGPVPPPPPYGSNPNPNPGAGPGPAPGSTNPFDSGSYTYRPGSTPEIDAPPRPPDRR